MSRLLIAFLLLTGSTVFAAESASDVFDLPKHGLDGWEGRSALFQIKEGTSVLDQSRKFPIIASPIQNKPQGFGDMKSPSFKITQPILGFYLGGSDSDGPDITFKAFVGLEVDGQIVLKASGWNNSEILAPCYFRLDRWMGKEARIVFSAPSDRQGWIEAGNFQFYPSAEAQLHENWGMRADDLVVADWADGTYQGWTTTGEAFRDTPMNLSLNRAAGYNMTGYIGCRYSASSVDQGRNQIEEKKGIRIDKRGTLTSLPFVLKRPYLNIQMAGGDDRENLYIELLVDGRQVRRAGGFQHSQVEWATFDVKEFAGRNAVLRLVAKTHQSNWDYIFAGLIVQSHEQYGEIEPDTQNQGATFKETFRPRFHYTARNEWINDPNGFVYADGWWHIMSQNSDFGEGMNMSWGHARSRNLFDLEYLDRAFSPAGHRRADKQPQVPPLSPNTALFPGACWSGSAIVDVNNVLGLKQGKHDTIVCFISVGDPCWIPGEEHPAFSAHVHVGYSIDGGMSWKPLVTDKDGKALPTVVNLGWQLMKITGKKSDEMILPPETGELKAKQFPPDQTPGIKPLDYGPTRDPKVIWYEPGKKFIMVVFTGRNDYFALLESTNLKDWKWMSTMRMPPVGMGECPDLFELPVLNEPQLKKWVFMTNNAYIVGDFDGRAFAPDPYYETRHFVVNSGRNGGPLQVFNQAPNDRKVCMAWMAGGRFPRHLFTQQFSLPTECTLRRHADGMIRLYLNPVKEFDNLRAKQIVSLENQELKDGQDIDLSDQWTDLMDIEAEFEVGTAREVGFQVKGEKIFWVPDTIISGDAGRPMKPIDGVVKMRVVIDMNSFELYANEGEIALAANFIGDWWNHIKTIKTPLPQRILKDHTLKVFAKGGDAKLKSLKIWQVREIECKDSSITGKERP